MDTVAKAAEEFRRRTAMLAVASVVTLLLMGFAISLALGGGRGGGAGTGSGVGVGPGAGGRGGVEGAGAGPGPAGTAPGSPDGERRERRLAGSPDGEPETAQRSPEDAADDPHAARSPKEAKEKAERDSGKDERHAPPLARPTEATRTVTMTGRIDEIAQRDETPAPTRPEPPRRPTRGADASPTGGGGGPGGGDGRFFGHDIKGNRVVFVVDHSGSMSSHRRMELAKLELADAITAMEPHQSFLVIFFDSRHTVMPPGTLLPATEDNKRSSVGWVEGIQPRGGTNPTTALEEAFKLKPDEIYLLSDGIFRRPTPERVKQMNEDGVRISTIALGKGADTSVLKQIASENNGHFTEIED